MMRTNAGVALSLCVVLSAACGGAERRCQPPSFEDADDRPTCLVLSSGAAKGIAHLGAVRALQTHATFPISCVTGTSMGALVGSLYATAPGADPVTRYRELMAAYEQKTRADASGTWILGALFGLATGGIGFGLVAGTVAASSIDPVQHQRFVANIDTFYNQASIETVSVPFATFHHDLRGDEPSVVTDRAGNLANAVGMSIANPLIFRDVNPSEQRYLDPALDRITAVPIEATCAAFPNSRIVAINVTHEEAFYRQIACPVLEVRIDVGKLVEPQHVLAGQGAELERLTATGEQATIAALRSANALGSRQ